MQTDNDHLGFKSQSTSTSVMSSRGLLISLVLLGSIIFLMTVYALVHFVDGLPRFLSVLFAFAAVATASLAVLVVATLVEVFRNTKAGIRGARLHRRLILVLCSVAVVPAVIAFMLTGTTLKSFADEYFVDRVSEANLVAKDLANGYFTAESRKMGPEIVQLAADLSLRARTGLSIEAAPIGFRRYLLGQSILRGFSAVTLIDRDGRVLVSVSARGREYGLPPPEAFAAVSAAGATPYRFAAHDPQTLDAYYAILKLGSPDEGFLVAYRDENPALSEQLIRVREFRDETADVRFRLADLSRTFSIGYGLVLLLLLTGAVWIGILNANAIVEPVRRLVMAAEHVSQGDLSSRVEIKRGDGELAELASTFNGMTEQLDAQRDDLLAAREQSDARLRFIETVLSGVPAGVLNVRPDGEIALSNPSADEILSGAGGASTVDQNMLDIAPELKPLFDQARLTNREVRDQIELGRDGGERIINARISPDQRGFDEGFVVTLDDITELVSAQRNAAWGDVARRIAHEIKNPLTPIQLSAERLQRKYGKQLEGDREIFDRCTDTIVRHVGDIGRMVNEFSSFARMPEPIKTDVDLSEVVRSSAFSFGVANPTIGFIHDMPDDPVMVWCDGRLIGQAVVNLVKNAVESIAEGTEAGAGKIVISVRSQGTGGVIEIADTGRGLPAAGRARLTEPYMTTRAKGTGLGLAIVRKAVEEHGGAFSLLDNGADGGRGATARIVLPGRVVSSTEAELKPELEQEGS